MSVFDPRYVNIFFVDNIQAHRHGCTFPHTGMIVVADSVITIPEDRTLAHELGHILSLDHIYSSDEMLMRPDRKGALLSPEEISIARSYMIRHFMNK